ncbi:hypothetical protein C0J45_19555 [Silurus meridionalis]|nr:hypothetical protein C0J45_19555 [Silurus meridionalis]
MPHRGGRVAIFTVAQETLIVDMVHERHKDLRYEYVQNFMEPPKALMRNRPKLHRVTSRREHYPEAGLDEVGRSTDWRGAGTVVTGASGACLTHNE